MDKKTFQTFREIVYDHSGIHLNETKEAMVSSRIAKRMRLLGLQTHKDYLKYLVDDQDGEEITKFLDVISTNVTSFFREAEHFDYLGNIAEEWIAGGRNRLRIWCAASSTGEEPYTIAMTLLSAASGKSLDMRILATDISTKVLAAAQKGEYTETIMAKVPAQLKNQFFVKKKVMDQTVFAASDILKKMIVFRRLNLSQPPFPMKGMLDAVFCRNVMIYFDNETRGALINEIYRLLRPGGYLFTGHAESLTSLKTPFQCLRPSIYRK